MIDNGREGRIDDAVIVISQRIDDAVILQSRAACDGGEAAEVPRHFGGLAVRLSVQHVRIVNHALL